MKDYIKECQAIANPFTDISYPSRPNPSPFAKWPKATPVKISNVVTSCNINKLSKPRKINVGYDPAFFQQNWLAKVREAEAVSLAALVVIPTQQVEVSFTLMQPATVPDAPTQPSITMCNQTKKSIGYCAICTPTGKQCSKEYPMPLK